MPLRWRVAQYLELWWWKQYLQNHAPADYLAWKRRYWRDLLERAAIALPPGARVLDAGCGPAGIFTVLDRQCVDAVDPLVAAYARALPHFRPSDYAAHVRFHAVALEAFDGPAGGYDAVFCLNAINHVADLDRCFDRLVELTRPGGLLVVSVDAHRSRLLRRAFRAVPGDVLHPHQELLAGYADQLERRGVALETPVLLKKGRVFNYYLLKGTAAQHVEGRG
jgi:2-polyprenyl-3-methyl-5-hydroxy-6-metoxy-1,4-benzoquinol methylase